MRVGIILPSLPNYSETFFKNKILGLEKLGHSVSLYVNTNSSSNANLLLPKSISVNAQPNVKNKIKLLEGIYSEQKLLIYEGEKLKDNITLSIYNIKNDRAKVYDYKREQNIEFKFILNSF